MQCMYDVPIFIYYIATTPYFFLILVVCIIRLFFGAHDKMKQKNEEKNIIKGHHRR